MLRLYILESYWHLDYHGADPAVIERLSKVEELNDPIIQAVHPLYLSITIVVGSILS